MWAWHPAEIARLLNVRSAPILLKKSKLAGLQSPVRSALVSGKSFLARKMSDRRCSQAPL